MIIKYRVVLIAFVLLAQSNIIQSQSSDLASDRLDPNLILILADDLGYSDVGFNGCVDIPTPNIDRIAEEGVVFTNGYVSYPVCGPSRAGIITGRYQDRFGFGRNPLFTPNDSLSGLPLEEETLAEVLEKADYKSIALGKWHLGAHPSQHPLKVGFSDFFGFLSGGHRYFPEEWVLADEFEAESQFDGYRTKLIRDYQRIEEKEYLTDALSREAVSYVRMYKDEPFFMYLAYNAPHTPLQATDKYLDRFEHIADKKRRTYAAMVSAMDDGIGKVLNELEVLGIEKNTIVVFLSDNGGPERTNASNNDPLRGQKGDLFEGGIRVPFAMKWKNNIPAEMRYHKPVISLDIFSTMIAQVDHSIQTKHELDGVNLIPFLNGEESSDPHDFLFWRKFDQKSYAMRSGEKKQMFIKGERQVYNLRKDIEETNNIIESHLIEAKDDWEIYKEWENKLKDPKFLGLMQNNEYDALNSDRFVRKPDGIKLKSKK